MIIYKVTNKLDSKCYIGQSSFNLRKRKSEHEKNSKKKDVDTYFHRALKKHGIKNFKWKVLYKCDDRNELDEAEVRFIKEFDSFGKNGYNLTKGGGGATGYEYSEEIREKISKKTKEGILKSDKSWSESHKGKKNGMFGKKHSKESIEKMRKNRSGIPAWNKGKKRNI